MLFSSNKWKVVINIPNIKSLKDYASYEIINSNILDLNYWCCYGNSNRVKFNINPTNKICLSGRIWDCYKERSIISKYQHVDILSYKFAGQTLLEKKSDCIEYLKKPSCDNIFIKRLSGYIASFTSSFMNTHVILMKVFEILSSGSLLVYPKREEEYIKNIGLTDRKNCFLIDFQKNVQEQINFILDYKNREYINKIRINGYEFSKIYNNSLIMTQFLKELGVNNK